MDNINFAGYIVGFGYDAVLMAGVPLAGATIVALMVALIQALTQIQDQTLSQALKMVTIVTILTVFAATLIGPFVVRTREIFEVLPHL